MLRISFSLEPELIFFHIPKKKIIDRQNLGKENYLE
jgi:hypothetical protein